MLAKVGHGGDRAVGGVNLHQVDPGLELVHGVQHYLPILVQLVVGELDLLEGHNLLGELVSSEGTVGVTVEAVRWRRVALASNQPAGPVVGIPGQGGLDTRSKVIPN